MLYECLFFFKSNTKLEADLWERTNQRGDAELVWTRAEERVWIYWTSWRKRGRPQKIKVKDMQRVCVTGCCKEPGEMEGNDPLWRPLKERRQQSHCKWVSG